MCVSHDVENGTDNNDPRAGYNRVEDWPRYPPGMQFEMGSGVAVDKEGIVYLFTRDIEHWATHPLAMKDKMGKSSISMFTRDGDFLGKWVSDGYWNSRLVWFTAEGEFIRSVGGWGRGPAQFNTPHAITQDSKGRILVADLAGGNFHDYMTVPGQIREERTIPAENPLHRIQRLTPDGDYIDEWTHIMPLSLATYGDKIYASDKMSNLAVLDEETGEVVKRVDDIAIYIHQLAMDQHGDLYTASVYPEHAGEKRGAEGPCHRRWSLGD